LREQGSADDDIPTAPRACAGRHVGDEQGAGYDPAAWVGVVVHWWIGLQKGSGAVGPEVAMEWETGLRRRA
jgi:hypothetical protein